jgi:tetratricopeptide (TPR) repeat protein
VAIDREKIQAAAQKYVEKKKYDKAVAELQKIIQEDPNDARTLLKIGDLQSKMAEFANAIATYERVGKFYAAQGFALKAIAVYKQIKDLVAKQVPHLEERYGHITPLLADLYQQLGLVSDALAALDEYATRLQRQGRDADGIEVFRRIVELDRTNPLPHLRLAEALSRAEQADEAINEFKDAAGLLVKLGRRDDAIKVFERLLHLKPDPNIARQAAEAYLGRGMGQDGMMALAKLQICFQADPKNLDTLALLARAFGIIGQANKGVEVQKEMARLAKEQGKVEMFRQLVDKLQRIAPNDEQVRALAMSSANLPAAPPNPVIRDAREAEGSKRGGGSGQYEEVSYDSVDSGELEVAESLPPQSAAAEDAFELHPSERPPPPSAPRHHDLPSNRPPVDAGGAPPGPAYAGGAPPGPARAGSLPDSYDAAPDLLVGSEAPPSADTDRAELRETIAQLVADAASFRRVRLYAKAVDTLRAGIELDAQSRSLREALRDALLESRRYPEAADEMVAIASLQIGSGDVDGAVRSLYDVIAIDPAHARALEMLDGLGVAAGGEPNIQDTAQGSAYDPSYDSAPLPAYEFDDGAEARTAARPSLRTDEPFGEGGGEVGDSPLPSFPLAPESETSFDLVQTRGSAPPPDAAGQDARADARSPDSRTEESRAPESRAPGELEEALEEADFFASRGLYDDARTILNEQLGIHPGHMLLKERLAELDSQEQGARGGSGTREVPASDRLDRSFDIAASLDALENLDTAHGMPSGLDEVGKQVDVEEVFAKFKEGVAAQVSADDTQSHYDLGVAYKEMGLYEDAMREFDVAAADPKRECVCRHMIGMILVERGRAAEAIEAFSQGLYASVKTPDQETALCYEIAQAYETIKRTKDALTYYQKVARRDANYRDVQERVRRLTAKNDAKPAPRAAAVGADDEFDRAFDEIIGGGKLP